MVSNNFDFTGSMVALVTPMDAKGNVDRVSLRKLVDYHVKAGTDAIVSVGTTGESATLSHDEHVDVVLMTLDMADGRIPVIAGTGANATSEAIWFTQQFENKGIAGCLTVLHTIINLPKKGFINILKRFLKARLYPKSCIMCPAVQDVIYCQ